MAEAPDASSGPEALDAARAYAPGPGRALVEDFTHYSTIAALARARTNPYLLLTACAPVAPLPWAC